MLAGIHRAAAEAPGLCVSWQPGSRPPWEALFEAAGKSSLEQSWAYGEAVAAQHGQIVERHVLVAEGEPLALLQAFRRRYWKVGVTRILRGPRSEERRVGKGGIRTGRSGWATSHEKKKEKAHR